MTANSSARSLPAPLLNCQQLDVSIGDLGLVRSLQLSISPGELVCIIGCNGAGKTTLLHTLAGLRDEPSAKILLRDRAISTLSRKEIAQSLAVLLQHHDDSFPITVIDAVIGARHPHRGMLAWESRADRDLAMASLQRLGLDALAQRDLASLSGGERQRVALAEVLTQQPVLYLLDEPLNNLDPRHQIGVMHEFRALLSSGAAVIAVMHDLNLVARFADRVLLLYGPEHGGAWVCEQTDVCMSAANLSQLYGTPITRETINNRVYYAAV